MDQSSFFALSETLREQRETERACAALLPAASASASAAPPGPALRRAAHAAYLERALAEGLGAGWAALDASRVWLVYWVVHSLDLLQGDARSAAVVARVPAVVDFLARSCQAASGGFGGGPGQAPHTASAYAAVLALVAVGEPAALAAIDRAALHALFLSLRAPRGGFRVQADGEADVRGAYTVLAVCDLLGMLTPAIREGAADFLLACQTYEGGFGAEPGNEAHGGYTFCALAGLAILGEAELARIDARALARWLARRQMPVEGGFSGRANKLVDGCYSFWQGACFAFMPGGLAPGGGDGAGGGDGGDGDDGLEPDPWLVAAGDGPGDDMMLARVRLQEYILHCCQLPEGGFRDKPGKARDFYHTCYCLSGLSVAQHGALRGGARAAAEVLGGPGNALEPLHPVFNLRTSRVEAARAFFAAQPPLRLP